MKKTFYIIVILGVFVVLVYVFRSFYGTGGSAAVSTKMLSVYSKNNSDKDKKTNTGMESPYVEGESSEPVKTNDVNGESVKNNSVCESFWHNVASQSLSAFLASVKSKSLSLSGCSPTKLNKDTRSILDACSNDASGNVSNSKKCRDVLVLYRASVIDRISGDNDPDSYTQDVLLNKLMAKSVGGTYSKDRIDYGISLADALIRKAPGLYAGYRAKLMYQTIAATNGYRDTSLAELSGLLNDCRELAGNDPGLFEIQIMHISSFYDDTPESRQSLIAEKAKKYISQNPLDPIGHYHMAAYYWYKRNEDLALKALKRAESLDPQNPRIKAALRIVKTGDFSRSIRFFEMNFAELPFLNH